MKKGWLRGMLLGMSLALLLSGGVALAQGLYMTFNKDCVECWSGQGDPTQDRYLVEWTLGGWLPRYELCFKIRIDGALLVEECGPPPPQDSLEQTLWLPCEWTDELTSPSVLDREVKVDNGDPGPLGEWVFRLWQRDLQGVVMDSVTGGFLVAETCEVEFVPEPGTIALLGSGLAGLAGYAALRWRARS